MEYEVIKSEFKKHGIQYKVEKRTANTALLSVQNPNSEYIRWEVVRIFRHNGREIKGNKIPPSEFLASASMWGINGFSFTHTEEDVARAKFEECDKLWSAEKVVKVDAITEEDGE